LLIDQVIRDGSLQTTETGFSFDLRLPWYRALPLACVEGLEVTLDGIKTPAEDLSLEIDGTTYALDDLAPLHDRAWYVTDAARVTAEGAEPAAHGNEHELDVTIHVRIPYIVESGVALVMRERCVKSMSITKGA
jgi:Domain of unknown function (DUF6379)